MIGTKATCFKSVRMQDKCLDAHLKAADCYLKNRSYFSAAKYLLLLLLLHLI